MELQYWFCVKVKNMCDTLNAQAPGGDVLPFGVQGMLLEMEW